MATIEACCAMKTEAKYTAPLDAIKGPREGLLYAICVYNGSGREKVDFLAKVDADSLHRRIQ